jgi:hypothetical protein
MTPGILRAGPSCEQGAIWCLMWHLKSTLDQNCGSHASHSWSHLPWPIWVSGHLLAEGMVLIHQGTEEWLDLKTLIMGTDPASVISLHFEMHVYAISVLLHAHTMSVNSSGQKAATFLLRALVGLTTAGFALILFLHFSYNRKYYLGNSLCNHWQLLH